MLADRENGAVLSAMFCDSADDLAAADRILNEMTPPATYSGRRVTVEQYEVLLDEDLTTGG